jgi:hypothetical protein
MISGFCCRKVLYGSVQDLGSTEYCPSVSLRIPRGYILGIRKSMALRGSERISGQKEGVGKGAS